VFHSVNMPVQCELNSASSASHHEPDPVTSFISHTLFQCFSISILRALLANILNLLNNFNINFVLQ